MQYVGRLFLTFYSIVTLGASAGAESPTRSVSEEFLGRWTFAYSRCYRPLEDSDLMVLSRRGEYPLTPSNAVLVLQEDSYYEETRPSERCLPGDPLIVNEERGTRRLCGSSWARGSARMDGDQLILRATETSEIPPIYGVNFTDFRITMRSHNVLELSYQDRASLRGCEGRNFEYFVPVGMM